MSSKDMSTPLKDSEKTNYEKEGRHLGSFAHLQ